MIERTTECIEVTKKYLDIVIKVELQGIYDYLTQINLARKEPLQHNSSLIKLNQGRIQPSEKFCVRCFQSVDSAC